MLFIILVYLVERLWCQGLHICTQHPLSVNKAWHSHKTAGSQRIILSQCDVIKGLWHIISTHSDKSSAKMSHWVQISFKLAMSNKSEIILNLEWGELRNFDDRQTADWEQGTRRTQDIPPEASVIPQQLSTVPSWWRWPPTDKKLKGYLQDLNKGFHVTSP